MRFAVPVRLSPATLAAAALAIASFPVAAQAADGPANPLGFSADLAIFSAIVFLLLLGFLTMFAWKPIIHGLERREQGIADDIETARRDREQAELRLREYEARLAKAETEIATLHAEAKRDLERMSERKQEEARAEADALLRRAKSDIESAKRSALDELTERSVDMAIAIASRIARKEIRQEQHAALIRDALDRFPASGAPNAN
ncbi:MAG TPA: F0F1 ATP synthase subunit B [Pirellulaceae bacterium]|jgi:F-type H+-transporting ATPase subunit b|nr:F0F1 ATP synthase subunit B [Pirellulaceae bacterium]